MSNHKVYSFVRKNVDFSKSNFHLFLNLAIDLTILSITVFTLQNENIYLPTLTIPLIAILMFRGFAIMHDATHKAIHHNRMINDFIGIFYSSFCFLPFRFWKNSHLQHHFWSGNVEHDPVMAFVKSFPSFNANKKKIHNMIWKSWIPILAIVQNIVFWRLAIAQIKSKEFKLAHILDLIIPIGFWISLSFLTTNFFTKICLLLGVVTYLMAVELVNFPHHLGLKYLQNEVHLPVWEQNVTARSCHYPFLIEKFVTLNFNLHIEHHMFPDAPWHVLPEIKKQVMPILGNSYIYEKNIGWNIKNRSLNLEDVMYAEHSQEIKQKLSS